MAKPSDSFLVLAGRYRPWRAVLAAAIAAVVCGATVGAEIIDRVVATVGSRTVTLSDVRAALALGLVSGDAAGLLIWSSASRLAKRIRSPAGRWGWMPR